MTILNKIVEASAALKNFPWWRRYFAKRQTGESDFLIPLVCHYDAILSDLIHDLHPADDFQAYGAAQVQYLAAQLREGVIPSLAELLDTFPESVSPECRHLLVRYAYFLNRAGEHGRLRGDQLSLALQLRIREKMYEQIQRLHANCEPTAPEAREYEACAASLKSIIHEIEQTLLPLLEKDPSYGGRLKMPNESQSRWTRPMLAVLGILRRFLPSSTVQKPALPPVSERKNSHLPF